MVAAAISSDLHPDPFPNQIRVALSEQRDDDRGAEAEMPVELLNGP